MSRVTKYWDKYRERHKAENPEDLIDKSYISFLEVQLERVSQAVLLTQNFSERIENVQSQLNSAEEKIINLTRLVKLQQNFAETQEEEINSMKAQLEGIDGGGRYYGLEGQKNKDKSHHIEEEISQLEEKLKIVLQKTENFEDQRNKSYEKFVRDVNSALKATEEKVMSYLTHAINSTEIQKSGIKKNFEGLTDEGDKELEEELNEFQLKSERNKEIRGLMSFGAGGDLPELKQIWAKLEEFGNFKDYIEKIVMEKDTEIKEATEMVWASERTCNRLAEDCTSKISDCERAVKDLEQFLVATAKEIKKIEIAQGIRPIDTDEIEKNITEKVNETVNKIGDLVKKYFNSQQDLQKEVKVLASKFYGKSTVPPLSPKFKSPIRKTEKPDKSDKPPISPLTNTLQELETSLTQSRHKRSISSDAEKHSKDDDSHELKHKSRSKSPKLKLSKKVKSTSSLTPDRKRSKSSSKSKSRSRSRSRSNSKTRTKSISELQLSPKSTKKSLAMESSIRQKIVDMKAKEEEEEQKISQKTVKRHSKLDKKKKKLEKLEKIYQKLSARDLK
ncbi:unnamed protein product [Blepharisma stoltei]|uniref:Uncharacterized protein n=1 Tax=Blepharisma stoltei TaxID=1481888 RepID=A0AAU9KC09_9CILI|nr:unnamed protein product [Blepharisma stoltei]